MPRRDHVIVEAAVLVVDDEQERLLEDARVRDERVVDARDERLAVADAADRVLAAPRRDDVLRLEEGVGRELVGASRRARSRR